MTAIFGVIRGRGADGPAVYAADDGRVWVDTDHPAARPGWRFWLVEGIRRGDPMAEDLLAAYLLHQDDIIATAALALLDNFERRHRRPFMDLSTLLRRIE